MILNQKTQIFSRYFLAIVFSLSLASCGSILDTGQDKEPDSIFYLEPLSASGSGGSGASLYLPSLTFPAYIGTYKIAVKPGLQEINYLAGARWSDEAPDLISRYLMVSLENGGQFHVQTPDHGALPHQYNLIIDVRDFSAHVGTASFPSAVVELEVSFMDAKTQEILASRNFSRNVSATENSKSAIAAAFQRAMDDIAGEMRGWMASSK